MGRISAAAVWHYPHLFAGMFVALSLGTGLIGITAQAIFAAAAAHPGVAGQTLTLRPGGGPPQTVSNTPEDMAALISILGLGATVSAFVTIMVVAGAAAFSVSLRRRDIALLRMAGAGKGTVRRMVIAEALIVAVPAAVAGSVIVAAASRIAFARLNATGLAAVRIAPGPLLGPPLLIAVGSGLLIAVLGALAGSGTATRTPPHAALREATLDSERPTMPRLVTSLLFLAAGTVMVGLTFGMKSDTATPVAIFGTIFLAIALIGSGPLFIPALLRLSMLPLRAADPVAARLAATSAGTARRRTSSLVAPVLGVLTVVGIFATVLATSAAGTRQDLLNRSAAELEIMSSRGLSAAELQAIRSVPGVATVATPVPAQVALAGHWDVTVSDAEAADLATLARTSRFTVVEGRLAPLGPGEVAMAREYAGYEGWHAGDTITYGVFGGHVRTARIAAIFDAGQALPPVVLPEGSAGAPPSAAQLRLAVGAPEAEVAKRLDTRLRGDGVTVTASKATVSAGQQRQDHANWIGLLILAAPASVYAVIGIASIVVMAASRRRSEVSVMRLLGLARFQVLRVAFWEALGTTLAGAVLAGGLVAFGLIAFRASVPVYGGQAPLSVPWNLLLTVAGGCLGTNVIVSTLCTAYLLRGRRPATAE